MLDNNQYSNDALIGPAQQLAAAGLSVIPVDGSKRPTTPWKAFQTRTADTGQLGQWFIANGQPAAPALAVVCGTISGGLTVLDFDVDEAGETWFRVFAAMVEVRSPGLLDELPHVDTPSGGVHLYLRAPRCEGNQELAKDAAGHIRIETRGEGGYVVAPPSPGYRTVHGSIRAVPRVGEAEYAILLQCARALSEASAPEAALRSEVRSISNNPRPGDAYNARSTLHEVADLLCRHGWTAGRAHGDKIPLTRPGKSPREGTSGDVAFINGIPTFTHFSSNGGPFEPRKGYSAFAVYALLEHGGDYRAAARALGDTPAAVPSRATNAAHQQQAPATAEPAWNWRSEGQDLASIWEMEFPPTRWFVDGIIPSGTTVLAGAPKTGKSLIAWQVALAAASGTEIFGKRTLPARPILYICLEDKLRLVKHRTMRMQQGKPAPAGLRVYKRWRPLMEGGIDDLKEYLTEHPGTDVIIDTYENIRAKDQGGNAYREDYAGIKPLTEFSESHNCNVLIVHHTAKAERSDVMQTVSGSLGITGGVDNTIVLERTRFSKEVLKLNIVGRDLDEDLQLAVEYNKDTYCHTLLGDADTVVQSKAREAIIGVLRDAGAALGIQEIADRVGTSKQSTIRSTLSRMHEDGQVARGDRGCYVLPDTDAGPGEDVAALLHAALAAPTHTHTLSLSPATAAASAAMQQTPPGPATELDNKSDNRTVGQQDCTDTHTQESSSPTSLTVRLSETVRCAGCDRRGIGLPAPYDPQIRLCSACGTELDHGTSAAATLAPAQAYLSCENYPHAIHKEGSQ